MLFVCHSNIWHKHCLKFLLGVKMAPRENENNALAKFGVTNKEHYGMFWYFLERSIQNACLESNVRVLVLLNFRGNVANHNILKSSP